MAEFTPTINPTNTVADPFIVKDQTLPDMIFALVRVLVVLFGIGGGILALLKARDIAGLIEFVKTNDVITLLGTVAGLAALIYGQVKTFFNKKKLITAAASAPNAVATVVTKT